MNRAGLENDSARARTPALFGTNRRRHSSSGGFTFAELLAALLFLSIVIPAALQGLAIANRASVSAERKITAARLADNLMNQLIVTGEWKFSNTEGQFGETGEQSLYRWRVETEPWTESSFLLLHVYVFYPVQGMEQAVRLSALVENE